MRDDQYHDIRGQLLELGQRVLEMDLQVGAAAEELGERLEKVEKVLGCAAERLEKMEIRLGVVEGRIDAMLELHPVVDVELNGT